MEPQQSQQYNPWRDLWLHPRKTLDAILKDDPKKIILWLAAANGIVGAFIWREVLITSYPDRPLFHSWPFLSVLLIFGIVFGIINLYIASWLYQLIGSWLKGIGTFTTVKCAVGWSYYPMLIAGIFKVLSLFSASTIWLQITFDILYTITFIWGFVVFLHLIGEAHKFSAWKSIVVILIAAVLIAIVLVLISLLIPLIQPLFTAIFV